MDSITLENYRCFQKKQTARLAPLTLLVGENSTGKTSFLALIRALWDIEFEGILPNFKRLPYDLGSFDEIAHYRGGSGGRAETFEAGFDFSIRNPEGRRRPELKCHCEVTFGCEGTAPFPLSRRLESGDVWIEEQLEKNESKWQQSLIYGIDSRSWKFTTPGHIISVDTILNYYSSLSYIMHELLKEAARWKHEGRSSSHIEVIEGVAGPTDSDIEKLEMISASPLWELGMDSSSPRGFGLPNLGNILAYDPVSSKPLRTYDPHPVERDPAGRHIPHYLAEMQSDDNWQALKDALQDFGQASGLFDEISVRRLGKRNSDPFQIQIRKYGSKAKGPERNLIDVGYGVSQVLPLITEMSSRRLSDIRTTFLAQNPEIHLHPQAQAALGSLFCEAVSSGQRMVIETHSDYILDRIRMEVREENSRIKPEDVSVLYFESGNLDVKIHSLELDESGNIFDVPSNYRDFFRRETRRFLGM